MNKIYAMGGWPSERRGGERQWNELSRDEAPIGKLAEFLVSWLYWRSKASDEFICRDSCHPDEAAQSAFGDLFVVGNLDMDSGCSDA
jgi:hypothetical protein